MEGKPRAGVALVPGPSGRGPSALRARRRRPGLLLPGLWLLLLARPASCAPDDLPLDQHNLSLSSVERMLRESPEHSIAHVALTETAPGSQHSSSLPIPSSPSTTAFDTVFFNQGTWTQRTADHSIFVAHYVSVMSNEVTDDDEMDNFLPETHWTTSRVVSPMRYVTFSPPGLPKEMFDPVLTPSLPIISLQDEEVTSAWQNPVQRPTTYAESPSHFNAFRSTFPTSEGIIPTLSRNLVFYPTDTYGHISSRTLPEIMASGMENAETLLFSSQSSESRLLGAGGTQQPSPLAGEVSPPPEDVLAVSTDRHLDMTTALGHSLDETVSPGTGHPVALSRTAFAVSGSHTHSALFSTSLELGSFPAQPTDVSYNPLLPGNSSETSELPGHAVVPSHAGDTPIWSPVSPFRPSMWCVSCTAVSPRYVVSASLTEKDVGSGDGAETLSLTLLEASSISPLSSVVADFSEFEDDPQEFNTLFPSRPTVPLSSPSADISAVSIGVSASGDTSGVLSTHVSPPHGPLSVPLSLDAAAFGPSPVAETQVTPSLVPTSALPDSSFPVTANKNTPLLSPRGPGLLPSYGLDRSVASSLFPDQEPASFPPHESASVLGSAPSLFSTPPLDFSSGLPPASAGLASPSPMSSDSSAVSPLAASALVETLPWTNSVHLQPPQFSVPNSTNLAFSQLWPSSELLLHTLPPLPHSPQMSLLPSFPSDPLKFSEAATVSLTDSEARFTSAFTETTSDFEFSLMSRDPAAATAVPPGSEPISTVHVMSLLTAVHATPILTESSLFPTPTPSEDDISATNQPTFALSSFSGVIPAPTVPATAVSLMSASSSVPEVVPSPLPTEPGRLHGPSFAPTGFPGNTSTALSTPDTRAASENPVVTAPNSNTASQNPHEGDTAPPPPSLHPGTTPTPEAAIHTPALVTTKLPYVCDITVPDAYLITTVLARRAVQEYIITSIKEVLRSHFHRVVELKVGPCGVEVWRGHSGRVHIVTGAGQSRSPLPSLLLVDTRSSLGSHSNVTSSGQPFLTPDEARFCPSGGRVDRVGTKGSKTRPWGDDLMISLPLIYVKGLGLEFKLELRVSAHVCFCTWSETEMDF